MSRRPCADGVGCLRLRSVWSVLLAVAVLLTVFAPGAARGADQPWFELPVPLPPAQYGNIVIDRSSPLYDMPGVSFSHWRHRLQYTCRVCHYELGFEMKKNETEITKEKLLNGEFCGACHNGTTAFDQTDCVRCHNGEISQGEEKFSALDILPRSEFGNKVDWTAAVKQRIINPKQSIFDDNFSPIRFRKFLRLEAEWMMIPPAVFSHRVHVRWLDCANCHPDVFNIKKKATKHFSMMYILEGKFCGVCHLTVAFPMDDCKRCHPAIKTGEND